MQLKPITTSKQTTELVESLLGEICFKIAIEVISN